MESGKYGKVVRSCGCALPKRKRGYCQKTRCRSRREPERVYQPRRGRNDGAGQRRSISTQIYQPCEDTPQGVSFALFSAFRFDVALSSHKEGKRFAPCFCLNGDHTRHKEKQIGKSDPLHCVILDCWCAVLAPHRRRRHDPLFAELANVHSLDQFSVGDCFAQRAFVQTPQRCCVA